MANPKKKQIGELDEHRRARMKAADEAVDLIQRMKADVAEISEFLAAEQSSIRRRGLSSKRLARLRLMAEDTNSAARFASKAIKG